MTWGDDDFPYVYESPEEKRAKAKERYLFRDKKIREHKETLRSIKESISEEIEAYRKKKLGNKEFYSGIIAEAIKLGDCQRKYELWLKDSEENKNLVGEIEKIILSVILDGKR